MSGVTLMELLVVLVLIGFVSTIVLDSAGNIGISLNRLNETYEEIREEIPVRRWLIDVIGSSIAVARKDTVHSFKGTANYVKGITNMSILGDPGKVEVFFIELEPVGEGTAIYYEQIGFEKVLLSKYSGKVEFSFLNSKGEEFVEWPPQRALDGSLPRLVVIDGDSVTPLIVEIKQRRIPMRDLRDTL